MKRRLTLALAAACLSLSGGAASADPYMGTVATFAFGFCPKNWVPADGTNKSISQNTALFALLRTQYGGDGVTTFAVPKVNVLTAPGSGGARKLTSCILVSGVYPPMP